MVTLQLSLYLILILCCSQLSVSIERPNILLIIVDDLGWNDLGYTGNEFISTPVIETLAKEGVKLTNYYVQPICSPSRSALLSGYHPIHTGMQHSVIASDEPWGLPARFKILPDYLKSLNYSTHLIGKWHQGFYSKRLIPNERGFDSFLGYLSGATDYYDRITRYEAQWGLDWYENDSPAAAKYSFQYTTDIITSKAIELIESRSGCQPWFIMLSHQAVHIANSPKMYQVPKGYLDKFSYIEDIDLRSYVALLATLDDSIGAIFNSLYRSGQANSTIVVFTSDNGAPNGSLNNRTLNLGLGSNQPLRGAKYTLWEGGVKGLSWVWANWFKSKGTLYSGLTHITDWLPTLYSFAGGDEAALPSNIYGKNLRYVIENNRPGEVNSVDDPEYSLRKELLHNIDDIWGVSGLRIGDYKIVNGTVLGGEFDDWVTRSFIVDKHLVYGAGDNNHHRGKSPASSPSTASWLALNQSLHALDGDSVNRENTLIRVECHNQTKSACDPVKAACLFNVRQDPCEYNNVASSHPKLVESMLNRLNELRQTAVAPTYKPGDPSSAPIHHNGYWTWWLP